MDALIKLLSVEGISSVWGTIYTVVSENGVFWSHYENTPIQIYWKFHHQKLKVFR